MRQLGPYRLGQELGRGGMGAVFHAQDQRTGQVVALKVLIQQASATQVERFRREATALRGIDHPHLVRVLSMSMQPPYPWAAFEYVAGGTLQGRVEREGPLPWTVAVQMLSQVAAGAAAAHDSRLLHRDIKPANVLLGQEGAKLADFGLVKDLMLDSLTASQAVLGTPAYMAPEQIYPDRGKPSVRTDVYGLAASLHFALTAAPPLRESGRGRSLRELAPDVPAWLDKVVRRGLAEDPAERHADAHAFRQALLRGASQPERQPLPWAGIALGALAACVLVLGALVLLRDEPSPPPPVTQPTPSKPTPSTPTDPKPTPKPEPTDPEDGPDELARPPDLEDVSVRDAPSAAEHVQVARALLTQQRYEDALAAYSRAIEASPLDPALHEARGLLKVQLGRATAGIGDLTRALEIESTPSRYVKRAQVYAGLEHWEKALRDFDRALSLEPTAAAYLHRSSMLLKLKQEEPALADLLKAAKLGPIDKHALERLVQLAMRLNKVEVALFGSDLLVELDPSAPYYHRRGVFKTELKRYPEAIADYTRAIELKPDYAAAYRDRATSRFMSGHADDALADYTRVLELQPKDVQTLHYRATVLGQQRRYEEALTDWARLIKLAPSANAYFSRGITNYNFERYEDALADFKQASELEPASGRHVFYQGMACSQLRQRDEAIEAFSAALRLGLDAADAEQARTRLAALRGGE